MKAKKTNFYRLSQPILGLSFLLSQRKHRLMVHPLLLPSLFFLQQKGRRSSREASEFSLTGLSLVHAWG